MRTRTDRHGVEHYPDTSMRLIPTDAGWRAIVWSSVLGCEIEGPERSNRWQALEAAQHERWHRQWTAKR